VNPGALFLQLTAYVTLFPYFEPESEIIWKQVYAGRVVQHL
jgi:hypothetical protein